MWAVLRNAVPTRRRVAIGLLFAALLFATPTAFADTGHLAFVEPDGSL